MAKYNEDDWCAYGGHPVDHCLGGDNPRKPHKKPGKVRCPVCRKRMTPQTLDTEPMGSNFEPRYIIPRHKKPHGKRRR